MNSWLMVIAGVLIFAVGCFIGWAYRDIYDLLDELIDSVGGNKPALGPTLGSYNDLETMRRPTAHVVNSLTPEQMEFKRQSRLAKDKLPLGPER